MTCIKFCGLTRAQDVELSAELGVQAAGFVLWKGSPRGVDVLEAARLVARLPSAVVPVGVFVRPTREEVVRAVEVAGIRIAQLHGLHDASELGDESWHVWVAASLNDAREVSPMVPPSVTVLLDAHDPERHGGTGRTIDWEAASQIARHRRVVLAGGLSPANVGAAIRAVRPHGVDVSSGIEDRPGIKTPAAMRDFVTAVRTADAELEETTSGKSA